jgi:hypothetical protein
MPARLPDDRTNQQIGGKVAEVLWGYYGQQGVSGTPLTEVAAPTVASQVYDDAYADTLLAAPPLETDVYPPPVFTPPVITPPVTSVVREHAPVVAAAQRYQVFQRVRRPEPVAIVPQQRAQVVQLGFIDGTTMDLAGDHPAAKALRAAADALTMRERSSR